MSTAMAVVVWLARLVALWIFLSGLFVIARLPREVAMEHAALAAAMMALLHELHALVETLFGPQSPRWLGPCPVDRRPKAYRLD